MSANNPILISPCFLSEQSSSELNLALDLLLNGGHTFKINAQNSNKAHLMVIDVDNEDGRKLLNECQAGQVKLLISSTYQTGPNIIGVMKPIDTDKLKNVLNKLFTVMQVQLAKRSSLKETDSNSTYAITDTIFHELLLAKNNKKILHVTSSRYDVFVDGKNQSLKTKGSLDDIRELISSPYSQLEINTIDEVLFQNITSDLHVITLHNVLWTAAIMCSNGNLLPGHDENQPVKLRAWPSFTRNDFKPEHLKLAALLAQRPISLAELAKQTNIEYSEIINFYNAAFAVDLIDKNADGQKVENKQVLSNPKKSNLLNKIASRLGFSSLAIGTN